MNILVIIEKGGVRNIMSDTAGITATVVDLDNLDMASPEEEAEYREQWASEGVSNVEGHSIKTDSVKWPHDLW